MKAISFSCPSCGANLQFQGEVDYFVCKYCGKQLKINREGSTILIQPVMKKLDAISSATDRTASELAIRRLRDEVAALEQQLDTFYARKGNAEKLFPISIIAILLSLCAMMSIFSQPDKSALFCGVAPAILGCGLFAFAVFVNKKWKDIISAQKQKIRDKEAKIARHLSVVE